MPLARKCLEGSYNAGMHAAVVESFAAPPVYREMPSPEPAAGEVLIQVRGAALSNLVRGQASGAHYSSDGALPFTPGNDGVGVTPEGTRVYFISPRAPYGSMAEYSVVAQSRTIPLAPELEDTVAAALGNPGLATWGALLGRAKLQPGEVVLINGATGTAGKQAVQVAKYLGAAKVIATGRNQQALDELQALGADQTISLNQPKDDLVQSFKSALHDSGVQVILDYLWGPSAEAILAAAAGHGSPQGEPRIRFIQIGSISGNSIPLSAQHLRSSGVELLGSGLGSLSARDILHSLSTMFAAAARQPFAIDIDPVPLAKVEAAWTRKGDDRRIVFIP